MAKSKSSSEAEDRLGKALVDPQSVYADPAMVLDDESLSDQQKITILKRWEYDARELLVAMEENMAPEVGSDLLDRVLAALHRLGDVPDLNRSPPTKHGGA